MRIKCNKCHKFIKINVLKCYPEKTCCMNCKNIIMFNKYFREFCKMIDIFVVVFVAILFGYIDVNGYIFDKLPVAINLINKFCALGIYIIIFVCTYVIFSMIIHKICFNIYIYIYNKKKKP